MRLLLTILALTIPFSACAATDSTPSPAFDPTGKVVEWRGKVTKLYRSADDTCFELQRHEANPGKFKTCVYGYYDDAEFGAGKWLKVVGTLQPEQADNLPLVLAAQVSLTSAPLPPRRFYRDPWYNPGYDPFFHPYRPYYW